MPSFFAAAAYVFAALEDDGPAAALDQTQRREKAGRPRADDDGGSGVAHVAQRQLPP